MCTLSMAGLSERLLYDVNFHIHAESPVHARDTNMHAHTHTLQACSDLPTYLGVARGARGVVEGDGLALVLGALQVEGVVALGHKLLELELCVCANPSRGLRGRREDGSCAYMLKPHSYSSRALQPFFYYATDPSKKHLPEALPVPKIMLVHDVDHQGPACEKEERLQRTSRRTNV